MEFTKINGYEDYLIFKDGTIISTKRKNTITLKQHINKKGYHKVKLSDSAGQRKMKSVHRLVGENFLQETYKKGLQINHKDCNKSNNHVDNLEWCTGAHNIQHALENNLFVHGEDHYNSKITVETVKTIKQFLDQGYTPSRIVKMMNLPIGKRQIYKIKNRKKWRHVA